jgi:hypothetical protein
MQTNMESSLAEKQRQILAKINNYRFKDLEDETDDDLSNDYQLATTDSDSPQSNIYFNPAFFSLCNPFQEQCSLSLSQGPAYSRPATETWQDPATAYNRT